MSDTPAHDPVELATELTIAWLGHHHNRVVADDVPAFLQSMFETVSSLGNAAADTAADAPEQAFEPAVSVRKSLASKDHIISMIDGKPYKTLRRHLSTNGLTPDEYRQRYNLKADYPIVAQSYSEARRTMAKTIGLGRKPRSGGGEAAPAGDTAQADEAAPSDTATAKPARRRTKKADAAA